MRKQIAVARVINREGLPMPKKARDPIQELQLKIDRKSDLVIKWTAAEKICTETDAAAKATRPYCDGMARSVNKKNAYEAELGGLA